MVSIGGDDMKRSYRVAQVSKSGTLEIVQRMLDFSVLAGVRPRIEAMPLQRAPRRRSRG
jgi:hypothetical protein